MLWRMPQHGEGMPSASADRHHVALAHRAELRGHRRHELPVVVAATPERLDLGLVDAVLSIEARALVGVVAAHALPAELCHEPFSLRAPELHSEPSREPFGIAHVVGMKVCYQHPLDGPIVERAS